jgi:hypothetical protein
MFHRPNLLLVLNISVRKSDSRSCMELQNLLAVICIITLRGDCWVATTKYVFIFSDKFVTSKKTHSCTGAFSHHSHFVFPCAGTLIRLGYWKQSKHLVFRLKLCRLSVKTCCARPHFVSHRCKPCSSKQTDCGILKCKATSVGTLTTRFRSIRLPCLLWWGF